MSSSVNLFAFISITFLHQSLGSKAATVKSPNGGKLAFFEFLHEFEIDNEDFTDAKFHTIGGFVIHMLKEIPATGTTFEWNGYHFEIVDKDGNRIDKILLTKLPPKEEK